MKTFPPLVALIALANFAAFQHAGAASILSTDFESTTPLGDITTSGAISNADGLTATVSATGYLSVVDSSGDQSLQFVDNNTVSNTAPIASKSFAGASSDGTGLNSITGTFALTVFNNPSASLDIRMMINGSGSTAGSSAVSLVSMLINDSGDFSYLNGGTNTNPTFNLTPSTEYLFTINLDTSSTVQDQWQFTIATAAAPATILFDSGLINTRVIASAAVVPNIIVWNAAPSAMGVSTTPFAQIDDLNFDLTSVPEPGSVTLLTLGFFFLGTARKRSNRI